MGELDGKVAIVTGAGRLRGIGRAAAVGLAKLGADVVVTGTGRDPSRYPEDEKQAGWRDIDSTAEQVEAQGARALPLVVDVMDRGQVQMMVDRTLEEFGRLDILMNNAASARGPDRVLMNNAAYARGPDRVSILELDPDIFQRVIDVKVTGSYLCTAAAIRPMIDQGRFYRWTRWRVLVGGRQDRQCLVDCGEARLGEHAGLQRGQLRHGRDDPVDGQGAGAPRHQRVVGLTASVPAASTPPGWMTLAGESALGPGNLRKSERSSQETSSLLVGG